MFFKFSLFNEKPKCVTKNAIWNLFLGQNCLTPDNAPGNCINFRFCNFIVNLIVQNQQKPDEAITNYLKKAICGEEGQDPKVCCPALVFASLTGTTTGK